jgi:hypothetical protein
MQLMTHSLKPPGFFQPLNLSGEKLVFTKFVFFKCNLCRYVEAATAAALTAELEVMHQRVIKMEAALTAVSGALPEAQGDPTGFKQVLEKAWSNGMQEGIKVGLYTLHSVYPSLESTRFQPLSL